MYNKLPSSSIYFKIPRILQDTAKLAYYLYQNSPPIQSRTIIVFVKSSLDTFIFYNNVIAKDANPTASNIIREGGNLVTTTYNVYLGEKYNNNSPEVQDTLHTLGQGIRFVCKLGFQAKANSSSDSVLLSRLSNIACDSIAVAATDLSKISQREGKILHYFTSASDTSVGALNFLKDKITATYILQTVPKATFRAIVADQVGEVIKLTANSKPIEYISSTIHYYSYKLIGWSFGLEDSALNPNYNFYEQQEKILDSTNYSINGYLASYAIGAYKVFYSTLPDLFLTGIIMLGSTKIATDYAATVISGKASIIQTLATIGTTLTVVSFKSEIFSYLSNITPELSLAALVITVSDSIYNDFIQNPLPLIGMTLMTSIVTSDYTQIEY